MTLRLGAAALKSSATAKPSHDLVAAAAEVRDTARQDPAAALQLLHVASVWHALARIVPGAGINPTTISGWSRPERSDENDSPHGLVALGDIDRLSVTGHQSFGATGADGPLLVLARDVNGDGQLARLAGGPHLQASQPIFDRAGFQQRWIDAASPVFADGIATIPRSDLEQLLLETAAAEELLHASLDLGLLEGFWKVAHIHVTTRTRPWQGQSLAKATDDPHLVRRVGEFTSVVHAAAGLFDEATAAFAVEPADAKGAVATARSYLLSAGRRVISGTIELLGASATSSRYGFDLFWRDFTAHAVAHPPYWPTDAIGRRLIRSAKDDRPS